MSDAIVNPKTFDLGAVLQGRSYPEAEVPFYLDEASALKLSRLERRIARLELLAMEDDAKAMAEEVEALKQAIRGSQYTYHLRGIPNKVRNDVLKKSLEKYPRERDFLGTELDNDDRDALFATLLWHAMTVKIVDPDGAEQTNLTVDQIQQVRDYLPITAINDIQEGINELTSGAKAGFEAAAQDSDFLSQP